MLLAPSLLNTLTVVASIWAPCESLPVPVLLLTFGLARAMLALLLLLVTWLSWVSVDWLDRKLEEDAGTGLGVGAVPSLRSILRLGAPSWMEEVEEGTADGVLFDGGSLDFLARRYKATGSDFWVAGSFLDDGMGRLRTPAYWSTEPSPSVSSPSSAASSSAKSLSASSSLSTLPRRLKTPVTWCRNGKGDVRKWKILTHN